MRYNLSAAQKIFTNNTLDAMWNHGVLVVFAQNYSYDRVNEALNKLVKNFETLRLYSDGAQNIYADNYRHCDYPFFSFLDEQELRLFARQFISCPFKKGEQLTRFFVFELNGKTGVVLCTHHISTDGYSGVLAIEMVINLLKQKQLDDVPRVSYQEYIANELSYKQTKRYQRDKEFWKQQFCTNPVCTVFADKVTSFNYVAEEANLHIPAHLYEKVENFCQKNYISLQSFFNTIYAVYLYKTVHAAVFTIGVPVLNRTTLAELNSDGIYMHIVPLLVNIKNDSFLQTVLALDDAQMNLFRHQKFTQDDIKELLKEEGKTQNNLFDIATDFQVFEDNEDYEFEFIYSNSLSVPLEIHLQSFGEKKHNLKIRYRTSMFSEREIQTMLNSIITMTEDAVENPNKKITELEMIPAAEKQKVLVDFNDTAIDYPRDKCVHELFEEQVARTPDKTAVVAVDKTLTYKELNEEANRIAHSLMEKGVGRGDIVGLLLPRKSSFLSALFGILKTGAAYLPVDGDFPEDRIKHILSDSNAKLCISGNNIAQLMRNEKIHNPQQQTQPTDICYCIFTSGSTGLSKGTKIYHRNLTWYISVLKTLYGSENINMPFFTSQCVDLTVPSFYFPLLTGGATYLYNEDLKDCLIDIFNNENLTIIKFTPTHINITNKLVPDKLCPNLRYIIVGGETLYTAACFEFLNKFGKHIEIHNEYGPTETTVSCTDYIFRAEETESYLSIGKPIANAQIYITDKYMNPVPIGVTGEICIAGDGVGAGYLNRPELTAEKFIDNPFGEGKLYRTGDLAYWREDGNIVFVGRNDFQVKIRGLRIELGEIEKAITAVDGIVSGVVVVRKDKTDRQLICAFYTGEEKSAKELRAEIGKRLPKYMIPHIFMYLENMPMTTSGKINRNALPELELENITTETEYVAPETQEEKALAEVVGVVLRINSVNMLDNFFNIGGDSINAIHIVSALEEKGYELRVADIMQSDTLADIAKSMKATSDKAIYNQSEVIGVIPFSPIMRAFLHERNTIPKDFVHFCIIATDCDEATARKAFDALISHHDMLRGSFVANGIEIHSSAENDIYSFKAICIEDTQKAKEYLNDVIIDDDKLVHVVFCETENENLIRIIVHHFLIDLVSWEVLMEDFKTAVNQIKNKEEISLPAKTASFKQWSEELWEYAEAIPEANKEYWKKINEALDHVSSFGANEENEVEKYSFEFDESFTDKLINAANKTYGTRTNEILLTALGGAASKVVNGTVGIIVETHGRTEFNNPLTIGRTIGWFTSGYPIVFNNNNNEQDALINIKETMRRMPKNGIEYLLLADGFHKNAGIKFNFYQNSRTVQNRGNDLIAFGSGTSVFPGKINVDCVVANNILSVNIFAPKGENKKYLCEELGQKFKKQIEKIVAICTATNTVIKTRSDFSDDTLTDSELDELKDLFDWTDD